MGRTNYFRIFAMLAFIVLAALSCKWTAESLYMWHPDLTIYGAWAIAVLSFVIASLCFSQLLKCPRPQRGFLWQAFRTHRSVYNRSTRARIFLDVRQSAHQHPHTALRRKYQDCHDTGPRQNQGLLDKPEG